MKSIKSNLSSAKVPDKGKIVNKLYCIVLRHYNLFLNLASCSEHFISIKHRILATFNINQKNQSERLYAFNRPMIEQIILSQEELYDCLLLLDVSTLLLIGEILVYS
jgi:hypothetical protein